MSRWVDTEGLSLLGVGICDRCKRAFPIVDLHPDPNSPGLKVCLVDLDELDPYRLPPRQTERINLPFVRPDVPLSGATVINLYLLTEDGLDILTEGDDPLLVEVADGDLLLGVSSVDIMGTEDDDSIQAQGL